VALLKARILRIAIAGGAAVLLIAAYPLWLHGLGDFLVRSQAPFKADMVVVLAGDESGRRIVKAAELVKHGYAPRILVSGPLCCYGARESDLAIPFAVARGYPREWFLALPHDANSTKAEARVVVGELKRRGVKRFIVVTSNYHTRRAGSAYRALVPAEDFRVVAAPDWAFRPDDWWRSRDGQKQVFFEWAKTVASWAGM